MEADFNLVEVDVNDFLTICADLGNLAIKVNRIAAARTTGNNDPDYLRFLLHGKVSFLKYAKIW